MKRLLLFLILICAKPALAQITDDFNRANNADLGAAWSVQTGFGAAKIISNAISATTLGTFAVEQYTTTTPTANQYAQATIVASAGGAVLAQGVMLRAAIGAKTGYLFLAYKNSTNTSKIEKYIAGADTDIAADNTVTWAATDTIKGEVIGTTLNLYRNGVLVVSGTDSSIASGRVGIAIYQSASSLIDSGLDNFSAGDVTATGAVSTIFRRRRK